MLGSWLGSRCLVGIISALAISSNVFAQNSSLIGGESFGAECYRVSQTAASTGSANRQDLELCDRAIDDAALSPKDLIASYVNRGVVHMAMNDLQSALKDLNHALSLNDDVGEAYVNRGNLWFLAARLEFAVNDYDKAIELGVEKPHVAHLNRGMALEQLGRFDLAKTDYESSLTYIENWAQATDRLARVKEKIKKQKRERQNNNSDG